MAKYTNEQRGAFLRTTIVIKAGETVRLCRCFKSEEFPFCDGAHHACPGTGPVIVEAVADDAHDAEAES